MCCLCSGFLPPPRLYLCALAAPRPGLPVYGIYNKVQRKPLQPRNHSLFQQLFALQNKELRV